MTTCNDSETKSPAGSVPAADTKATSVIVETPQLEAPKSDAIETAGVLLEKTNDVPARVAPQRLDASSLKALSAVAAIAEAPALEPAPTPAEPLTADDPPLSARSAGAAAAAPIATAQKQPGR